MLYNNGTFASIILHSLVNVDFCFYIFTFLKKYPSISIQIRTIGGFGLYGTVTHFFRFIQVLTLYRQVIGIIIQGSYIVFLINQSGIVCGICLHIHLLYMIKISHNGIEIRNDILITFICYLVHSFFKNLQCLVCFLFLMIGQSHIIVEFQYIRSIFQSRST